MDKLPAPGEVAKRVIALYGGPDALRLAMEKSICEINERWNQDAVLIGRLLRAHLFVEHFLTAYLSAKNPNLGDIEMARLSFSQKVSLADYATSPESYLFPGVRHLNKVRNRIAHTMRASVTSEDRDVFLAVGLFKAMRDALASPEIPSNDPVGVLEEFALHAGGTFATAVSPDSAIWRQALSGLSGEGESLPPNTSCMDSSRK